MRRRATVALVLGCTCVSLLVAGGCTALLGVTPVPAEEGGSGAQAEGGQRDAHGGMDAMIDGSDARNRDAKAEASDAIAHDAGSFDAPSDRGGGDTGVSPDVDAAHPGCDGSCCILYVSADGSDGNSGCTPTLAMRTIKAAVGDAASSGVIGQQVRVCGGIYTETDLTLTVPITVMGGYNCTTWDRTAAYGYPSFDKVNETIVQLAPSSTNTATLTIGPPSGTDAGVTRFTVDGFTIQGAAIDTTDYTYAVLVENGMTPTLSNNILTGGSSSLRPSALTISNAAPEVTNNSIGFAETTGGNGTSVGLIVGFAPAPPAVGPFIHMNTISGGTTTATAASVYGSIGVEVFGAVEMTAANGAPLKDNAISGGTGTGTGPDGNSAVGVLVQGGCSVDIVGNSITAGPATEAEPGVAATIGVYASAVNALTISGNRIFGGETPSVDATTIGVVDNIPTGPQVIVDNFIHGGVNASAGKSMSAATIGLSAADCSDAFIEDNTIFSGSPPIGGFAFAVQLISSPGTIVRGNILAGPGDYVTPLSDYALDMDTCANIARLDDNLFIGQVGGTLVASACNGSMASASDVVSLETIDLPTKAANNVQISSSCTAAEASSCISLPVMCPSHVTCLAGLFAGWDYATYGVRSLFAAGAWSLQAGDPCDVTQKGFDSSPTDAGPTISTDGLGMPRASMPSMGAAQFNGACQ